jgi:hypothetical protein
MCILNSGASSQMLAVFKFFILYPRTPRSARCNADAMKVELHTRSAKATPLAFLPVAFRGLVVFPNAFLLPVVDDDSNSAIPLTESENMLVFLALFGAGGLPIPGS